MHNVILGPLGLCWALSALCNIGAGPLQGSEHTKHDLAAECFVSHTLLLQHPYDTSGDCYVLLTKLLLLRLLLLLLFQVDMFITPGGTVLPSNHRSDRTTRLLPKTLVEHWNRYDLVCWCCHTAGLSTYCIFHAATEAQAFLPAPSILLTSDNFQSTPHTCCHQQPCSVLSAAVQLCSTCMPRYDAPMRCCVAALVEAQAPLPLCWYNDPAGWTPPLMSGWPPDL